jgi:rhodanese-related sulfurtransferase
MENLSEILSLAESRGKALERAYRGEFTPREALCIWQQSPNAKLVDVRTRAEWDWVGRVPGAIEIEWNQYPGGSRNPDFIAELTRHVAPDSIVMFLCRSGARSVGAATLATEAGYASSFNILEGFEGDKDGDSHRNTLSGWRHAGLPWVQG